MKTNCEECPLKGTPQVLGEGSRIIERQEGKLIYEDHDNIGQYDVVIVGMEPGINEIKEKRPFVGASGKILRNTLEQMGVKEYYLTNVLRCFLPEEEKDALRYEAMKCCGDRCLEEVKARKPKLTIALGDVPLHYLTDLQEYSIKEIEGRIVPSKVGYLLPLTHPAYYWRRPVDFFDFIECMRPGIKFLDGVYEQAVQPTLEIVTPENLDKVRNEIDKYEEIGIDTETTGLSPYGWEPNKILEMGLAVKHDHAYIVPLKLIPEFKKILEEKKGVYWNASFDCAFFKQLGINPKIEFDGMLAHYTMDERSHSHGLKRVAKIYLGCEDWEANIQEYLPRGKKEEISYEVIPTDVRYEYLSKDVTRTLQLKKVLESDMNKPVMEKMLMPATRMFIDIMHRGMRVDPVKLMSMAPLLEDDMSKIERELYELTGSWINPNSFPQVSELVYEKMEIPIDNFFGKTTSKAALEPYKDDEIIGRILDYRELKKMSGTYITGFAKFLDHDYRIHPSINLFKAVTGRLSSDRPSIMNIKRDGRLKEIFLPDSGKTMLYGDISGNELRWYAIVGEDEVIRKALNENRDIHYEIALVSTGGNEVEAKDEILRTIIKAGVFGDIYQRSRTSMQKTFGDRADAIIAAIRERVPNIKNYHSKTMQQVRKTGYLESYFGRRRRFLLITPDTARSIEREAVNFPVSSPASDTMLLNMLHLWEIRDKWGIFPYWPVHDSITMDGEDASILPLIKKELEEYSGDLVNNIIPFIWKMDFGKNWAMQKD